MAGALVAPLVGMGGLTAVSIVPAIVFWLGAAFALRRMAKADPIMSRAWLRHGKQQEFYPAKANRWRVNGGHFLNAAGRFKATKKLDQFIFLNVPYRTDALHSKEHCTISRESSTTIWRRIC